MPSHYRSSSWFNSTCYISKRVLILLPQHNEGTSIPCSLSLPPFLLTKATKCSIQLSFHMENQSKVSYFEKLWILPSPYLTLRHARHRTPWLEWQTEQSVFPAICRHVSFVKILGADPPWENQTASVSMSTTNLCKAHSHRNYCIACSLLHHIISSACDTSLHLHNSITRTMPAPHIY